MGGPSKSSIDAAMSSLRALILLILATACYCTAHEQLDLRYVLSAAQMPVVFVLVVCSPSGFMFLAPVKFINQQPDGLDV